jgi:hypothetical protein
VAGACFRTLKNLERRKIMEDESRWWKFTKGALVVSATIVATALVCVIRNALSRGEGSSSSAPWDRVNFDTHFGWEEPWCDGK